MSPHTASQKYSFDWRHVSFPASSPSLSPLQGLQPWQFPKNTCSKEEPLLTAPLYGDLHLHTFPRICWQGSERRKVRVVVVDRPRLCRASSADANVEGLKNSNTHQRIAKAIFFSFDALSSRTLMKLNKAPPSLFSSSMPPPESGSPLILVGYGVFNRRVMQLASRGECDRARVGSSLVDFEGSIFFFGIFGKNLHARATRNKENNNSGLSPNPNFRNFASYLKTYWVSELCKRKDNLEPTQTGMTMCVRYRCWNKNLQTCNYEICCDAFSFRMPSVTRANFRDRALRCWVEDTTAGKGSFSSGCSLSEKMGKSPELMQSRAICWEGLQESSTAIEQFFNTNRRTRTFGRIGFGRTKSGLFSQLQSSLSTAKRKMSMTVFQH